MATDVPAEAAEATASEDQLERSTYEIIRKRLETHGTELRQRLDQLNQARRDVFGAIETRLLATERLTTTNNCIPRDMVAIADQIVVGYNVHIGLKSETQLSDVFSVYRFADGTFHEQSLALLQDELFVNDFQQLYRYYKETTFARFFLQGPHLYLVFQVGKNAGDIKAFKWLITEDGQLRYLDNRSDYEVRFPAQHEFQWTRTHRDLHRSGTHPHISIEDRVFVETVGGDLTIKVEDNTDDGTGIYSEPVDDPDQVLDDAEVFYATVGNLILLKIRPYQETQFRYFIFNEKIQQARRLDAIQDACVLLPEGHGVIFANGYYLQAGDCKVYDSQLQDLMFERRLASSNGEDYLYVFFQRQQGVYVLLSYNMIEQQVAPPMVCHGYSFFDNGQLVFFKAGAEPQKHHALQIWQTPYVGPDHLASAETESYLYKVGNRDLVRGMAECHEILNLLRKDEGYADLYVDLVKKTTDVLDSYYWLSHPEASQLDEVLQQIRQAASAAVSEYDKVVRVRRTTRQQLDAGTRRVEQTRRDIHARRFDHIDAFVQSLAELRRVRGEVIELRELRYVDLPAVDRLEQQVQQETERISQSCVQFLLGEESLRPYEQRVADQHQQLAQIQKVAQARQAEEQLSETAEQLEMLIEVVSNLKIEDATQRTQIIDAISAIYANLNRNRAALKKISQQLQAAEGAAEFASQIKLLGQAVLNYLDVCDTPEKCDEYLTKLMVQVEELEGRFAEFDQFLVQLSEKREEIHAALDGRRVALVEARNRRAAALASAADRILKGVQTRVRKLTAVADIHSYFAGDLMIEKVREIVQQLADLEDTVKVDEIQSRLKAIREDAIRQLKDRQELFVDGAQVIQLGRHRFSVNQQELDLTTVVQDGQLCFHLTGTKFLEPIQDELLQADRALWDRQVVSETPQVYRAEYLAYRMFCQLTQNGQRVDARLLDENADARLEQIQQFMAPRYDEGYVKGVHDHDALLLLRPLLEMHVSLGLLRYASAARALANIFWLQLPDARLRKQLQIQWQNAGVLNRVFPDLHAKGSDEGDAYGLQALQEMMAEVANHWPCFSPQLAEPAARYLADQLAHSTPWVASHRAVQIARDLLQQLERRQQLKPFQAARQELSDDPRAAYMLLRRWVQALVRDRRPEEAEFIDEAAALLLDDSLEHCQVVHAEVQQPVTGLIGSHPVLESSPYRLHYHQFLQRLGQFQRIDIPRYQQFVARKKELVQQQRSAMRLNEFKPRVLTSFVRNRLLDQVYLPMIGDNLAKQIGVVGEQKRTDLMGLLLLVSPPGYGKTTLMEYLASRLGLTFVKINGPAVGHQVTSLDPAEAPNAGAREEIEKLNLALEMGDNVMLYLDDIQHCNPELLQKFISLCDAQRKIEGTYRGRSRTYDLRGRKVAVVMAGNPYTESGERFQIPDMLANRADTYNLGDVIGDNRAPFELSYLENSLTSNTTLNQMLSRHPQDVHAVIQMAETDSPEGVELEGNYSVEELNDLVSVMRKLIRVRDVVLRVNEQYIESAAQADAYRTEPPFKLQGSYRDMNKLAERVVPVMNDQELEALILSHYENQAQTLTSDAEANLLKLKEMLGKLTETEAQRWQEIRRRFQRNLLLGGAAEDDKLGRVVAQMTTFSEGLHEINQTLDVGMRQWIARQNESQPGDASPQPAQFEPLLEQLRGFHATMAAIQESLSQGLAQISEQVSGNGRARDSSTPKPQRIHVVNKIPSAFLEVIQTQFDVMRAWLRPMQNLEDATPQEVEQMTQDLADAFLRYDSLLKKIQSRTPAEEPDGAP